MFLVSHTEIFITLLWAIMVIFSLASYERSQKSFWVITELLMIAHSGVWAITSWCMTCHNVTLPPYEWSQRHLWTVTAKIPCFMSDHMDWYDRSHSQISVLWRITFMYITNNRPDFSVYEQSQMCVWPVIELDFCHMSVHRIIHDHSQPRFSVL